MARVNELAGGQPVLVSLSGGNPALQPLGDLIALGRRDGHSFVLETQGSLSQEWFADLDWLILSPKPPSSDMRPDLNALDACVQAAAGRPGRALKVAVFDEADYSFARMVAARHPSLPVYLQVGNPAPFIDKAGKKAAETADVDDLMRRFRWLVSKVVADRWFAATVLPQLHVLAWGSRRGV
jgi:7-carboxy-7-deazaguanine synthase